MPTNNTDHTQINDKAKRLMEGIGVWGAYYRANPHRFCVEYLGLMLYPFQQILLVIMNIMSHFMYIAARGQHKLRREVWWIKTTHLALKSGPAHVETLS